MQSPRNIKPYQFHPEGVAALKFDDIQNLEHHRRGDFIWTCSSQEFARLAELGVLPDNNLPSNKIKNIYGRRVLELLEDKGKTLQRNSKQAFFRRRLKRLGVALGNTHAEISLNKRLELFLCSFMVKKIAAIQEIETLLNQPEIKADIFTSVRSKINVLKDEIKGAEEYFARLDGNDLPGHYREIFGKPNSREFGARTEYAQLEKLEEKVNKLKTTLEQNSDPVRQNRLIQTWVLRSLRYLNNGFQVNQGIASTDRNLHDNDSVSVWRRAARMLFLFPFSENTSNSNTLQEADYELDTMLVYGEQAQISATQHWQVQPDQRFKFASHHYIHGSVGNKQLLLAANYASLDGKVYQVKEGELSTAFETYLADKDWLERNSLAAKEISVAKPALRARLSKVKQNLQHEAAATGHLLQKLGQNLGDSLGLETWRQTRANAKIAQALLSVPKAEYGSVAAMLIEADDGDSAHVSAPLPRANPKIIADDLLSHILKFAAEDFAVYFDKNMSAKRPLSSGLFFWMMYAQFGGSAISLLNEGGIGKAAGAISHWISSLQAGAANGIGQGLNSLPGVHIPHITPEMIQRAVDAVSESEIWFFAADHNWKEAFVMAGITIGKGGFTVADNIFNMICGPDIQSSVFFEKIMPFIAHQAYTDLEQATTAEKRLAVLRGIVHFVIMQMLAAGLGVVNESLNISVLQILGTVPLHLILHPNIQTIGAVKASSIIAAKILAIAGQIKDGSLQIEFNSPEYQLLQKAVILKAVEHTFGKQHPNYAQLALTSEEIGKLATIIERNRIVEQLIFPNFPPAAASSSTARPEAHDIFADRQQDLNDLQVINYFATLLRSEQAIDTNDANYQVLKSRFEELLSARPELEVLLAGKEERAESLGIRRLSAGVLARFLPYVLKTALVLASPALVPLALLGNLPSFIRNWWRSGKLPESTLLVPMALRKNLATLATYLIYGLSLINRGVVKGAVLRWMGQVILRAPEYAARIIGGALALAVGAASLVIGTAIAFLVSPFVDDGFKQFWSEEVYGTAKALMGWVLETAAAADQFSRTYFRYPISRLANKLGFALGGVVRWVQQYRQRAPEPLSSLPVPKPVAAVSEVVASAPPPAAAVSEVVASAPPPAAHEAASAGDNSHPLGTSTLFNEGAAVPVDSVATATTGCQTFTFDALSNTGTAGAGSHSYLLRAAQSEKNRARKGSQVEVVPPSSPLSPR